jgi:hypothetical protein
MIITLSFKKQVYKYLPVALLALPAFTASAQTSDTTTITRSGSSLQDTDMVRLNIHKSPKAKNYHNDTSHSPQKAVIYSLIIPGLGQVYNRKIWKVPVIYGGMGLLGLAIVYNIKSYREFLQLSLYRYKPRILKPTDPYYNEYQLLSKPSNYVPNESIYNAKDIARRDRDLSYLGLAALWGVNVIDAYIDAKFIRSYNLDNNFSMHVTPTVLNQPLYAQNFSNPYIPGIKINFTL